MDAMKAGQDEETKTFDEEALNEDEERADGLERYCGSGRVWIFLVLGMLTLVFSAVLAAISVNVRSLTTSLDSVELVPAFVPAAVGCLAGLFVLLLFWKRYAVLVYIALLMCVGAALLCVVAAVLSGTHVLQPLLSVSSCAYSRAEKTCRCATEYWRDHLYLEKIAKGEPVFLTVQGVVSCSDVEHLIPGLLFTMIAIYGIVSFVCVLAAVISVLVHRIEQKRKYLQIGINIIDRTL